MAEKDKFVSTLEKQYVEIMKLSPNDDVLEEPFFEQPHEGKIVQTITTYSVSDIPEEL